MYFLAKVCFGIQLLISFMGIISAQAPVQEPIPELQWQQAGLAFMAGLYPHAGAGSVVHQLPPYVAKDIVEIAKPKVEYGFIKNCTDKPIVFLKFEKAEAWPIIFFPSIIENRNYLRPQHQISFFIFDTKEPNRVEVTNYFYIDSWNRINYWVAGLFDVYIELLGEPQMVIKNLKFLLFMNIKVYKDGDLTKLEVTCPAHKPEIYSAVPEHY